jgi:hypothetical protein
VPGGLANGRGRAVGGQDQTRVNLGGELMDQLGQFGVGMQFQLAGDEVVVGLGLLERRLPVLRPLSWIFVQQTASQNSALFDLRGID